MRPIRNRMQSRAPVRTGRLGNSAIARLAQGGLIVQVLARAGRSISDDGEAVGRVGSAYRDIEFGFEAEYASFVPAVDRIMRGAALDVRRVAENCRTRAIRKGWRDATRRYL